jgi:hypothetical protein
MVSLEINTAIENGYQIAKIFEIWHWDTIDLYNIESKTGGLFTDYVNCMLKIKQEASRYPAWVQTEDDKDKCVQEYNQKEGIRLDKEKIKLRTQGFIKTVAYLTVG